MKLFAVLFAFMFIVGTVLQGATARNWGYDPCWPNPCPWGKQCIPRYWGWRRYQCVRYGPYFG